MTAMCAQLLRLSGLESHLHQKFFASNISFSQIWHLSFWKKQSFQLGEIRFLLEIFYKLFKTEISWFFFYFLPRFQIGTANSIIFELVQSFQLFWKDYAFFSICCVNFFNTSDFREEINGLNANMKLLENIRFLLEKTVVPWRFDNVIRGRAGHPKTSETKSSIFRKLRTPVPLKYQKRACQK